MSNLKTHHSTTQCCITVVVEKALLNVIKPTSLLLIHKQVNACQIFHKWHRKDVKFKECVRFEL
jgi:hypothetical protein